MRCSGCGAEIAEDTRFCAECGRPAPRAGHCAACGAELPPSAAFCGACGAAAAPSGTTAPVPPAQSETAPAAFSAPAGATASLAAAPAATAVPVPAPRPGPSSAPAAKGQGPVIAVFAVAALAVLAAAYLLFLSPFRPFTLFGDAGSRQADSAGSSTPTGVVVVVATGGASPAAVSPTSVTPATATAGSVAPTAIVAPTAVPVALPTAAPARAPTVPPVPAFTLAGQWKGTMIANSVVLDIPSVDPEEVEKFQEELETLKGQEVAVVIEFRPQSPTAGSIAATVAQPDGSQSREQGTYRYENGQVTITSDNESDATHMSMKGRVSEGGLLAKIEGTWRSVSPITDSDTGEEIGSIESEGTWAISRPN